uniref:Putative nuclease HARBI1 n=1 Tax=Geotrypetes seraphini TaxID=260995 RepID=A0A6P8PI30_GEOSA|nr:putative nuclease HARBI1 [Geotrypetes seraphini]
MDGAFLPRFLQAAMGRGDDGERRVERPQRMLVHGHQPRVFRVRVALQEMSDQKIVNDYRLTRTAILDLYEEIRADIDPSTARSHAVPGLVKLLTVLRFLGTGTFQRVIGCSSGVNQSSVSRHLSQVLRALKKRAKHYINFPEGEEQQQEIKQDFSQIAGMPSVLGAIDCTHVLFTPPSDEELMYLNHKMGYSLNVQVVCDSNLRILDVASEFPGSCHDSDILANSTFGKKLAEGKFGQGWLLGDSGYGCKPWLMTPLLAPRSEAEKRYNEAHISTRCTIERTLGVLKSRFNCLHPSGGSLQYRAQKVSDIVTVCCMLHNIALRHQVEIAVNVAPSELDISPPASGSDVAKGNAVRRKLIEEYFS